MSNLNLFIMKKQLHFLKYALAVLLFASWNLYAQDYHFTQGFMENGTPEGWSVKDVSYSSSATNAANMVDTAAHYCAKMKTNNGDCWIQAPMVNAAGVLSFWCKVKDASLEPSVAIQTSPDGVTWTDVVVNPVGLDLADDSTFQNVSVEINQSGAVILRIYVTSATLGNASDGTLTVDDIQLTKPTPSADDVTLSELTVGGRVVSGFDFSVTSYAVDVTIHGNYEVAAVANNPNATVTVEQVTKITGSEAERTATVTVTGEDGTSTASTTVLITRSDYFWKEGFGDVSTGTCSLEGWEASHIYQSASNVPPGAPGLYPGTASLKFTGGHPTGSITDPGILKTPKIMNVGTLTFWVAIQKKVGGESLTVKMLKGFGMPTVLWSMDENQLPETFQEVTIEINQTDSIEILFEAICDVNDDGENRIWIDDLMITGLTTSVKQFQGGPSVSLYPNPVQERLNILAPDNAYQRVEIFNITGQKVMEETLRPGQSDLTIRHLNRGIYLISFSGKAGKYTSKFVKE